MPSNCVSGDRSIVRHRASVYLSIYPPSGNRMMASASIQDSSDFIGVQILMFDAVLKDTSTVFGLE